MDQKPFKTQSGVVDIKITAREDKSYEQAGNVFKTGLEIQPQRDG